MTGAGISTVRSSSGGTETSTGTHAPFTNTMRVSGLETPRSSPRMRPGDRSTTITRLPSNTASLPARIARLSAEASRLSTETTASRFGLGPAWTTATKLAGHQLDRPAGPAQPAAQPLLAHHPQSPEPADAQLDGAPSADCDLVALADPVRDDGHHGDDAEAQSECPRRDPMRRLRGSTFRVEWTIAVAARDDLALVDDRGGDQVVALDRLLQELALFRFAARSVASLGFVSEAANLRSA